MSIKKNLKTFVMDVNKSEITSQIKDGTLDQWIKSWRAAIMREIEKLPNYEQGYTMQDERLMYSESLNSPARKVLVCRNCNTGIVAGAIGKTNFCPNCGAEMESEE